MRLTTAEKTAIRHYATSPHYLTGYDPDYRYEDLLNAAVWATGQSWDDDLDLEAAEDRCGHLHAVAARWRRRFGLVAMTRHRCVSCRWWTRQHAETSGVCGRIVDGYAPHATARIDGGGQGVSDPMILETEASFGCVLWQGRDA